MLSKARLFGSALARHPAPTTARRGMATAIMNVFNQDVKTIQRERAALKATGDDFGYMRDEISRRLLDRLAFVTKTYPVVVDLGCGNGNLGRLIASRALARAQRPPANAAAEAALLAKLKSDPNNPSATEFEPTPEETQEYLRIFSEFSLPGVREFVQVDCAPTHVATAHSAVADTMARLAEVPGAVVPPPAAPAAKASSLFGSLFGGGKDAAAAADASGVPTLESSALAPALLTPGVPLRAAASNVAQVVSATAPDAIGGAANASAAAVVGDGDKVFNVYSATAPLGTIPIKPNSANLITSVLAMHWINDLPGYFKQVIDALAPDGVFIGALYGGESLRELRSSFAIADLERIGGVMPHMSPLTRSNDVGDMMKAAGFNLLTVDLDSLQVHYPDMFTLIEHLHGMGEQHAPQTGMGGGAVSRDVFLAANAAYDHLYRDPANGLCLATVDVVMMIGWKPHASQPKPKARGSAQYKLGEDAPMTGPTKAELKTTSVKPSE